MYFMLKSMYEKLLSSVRVSNNMEINDPYKSTYIFTDPFRCTVGTRQGDLSSTNIFNLYINELPNFLKSKGHKGIFFTDKIPEMLCMMYADDVVICAETAVELKGS